MRSKLLAKSPFASLQRLVLFSAILALCFAETAAAQTGPFSNISSRAEVLAGDKVVIAGFTITSTASATKQVVIRGLGPSTGIPGALADPTLTLSGPNGHIHSNNDWRSSQESAIAATGLQPGNNLEAAIIWTLGPGAYTVTFAGNNGGTGVGLIEVYDVSGGASIVNLSSRAQVGTGNNVLIGGVNVRSTTPTAIRALGPTLGQFGIPGALADPMLELYNASGTMIASNNNWATDPQAGAIQYNGLAPGNSPESAIFPILGAGAYTVIVKGVNNGTGVGLVDLYSLPGYPRIFQAWGDADNLAESRVVTVARHDLMWTTQNGFGWNWVDANGASTEDYRSTLLSLNGGPDIPYPIPTLRSLNPNMKILVQVALVALEGHRLPADHEWWKRDGSGNRVAASGGGYLLNLDNASLRAHIGAQAAAFMQTGQFDGVMLDSVTLVNPSSLLLPIFTAVRDAIGANGLIVVNANAQTLGTAELGQVNGVFMETGKPGTGSGYPTWQQVKAALDHNEANTRAPKVNCLETWYVTSRTSASDLKRMRATTALALTHSNGFALFSDPNSLPSQDHLHNWYDPFWSNHNLGAPAGGHTTINNIADRRDFQNGTVIWNASTSTSVSVTFPQTRKSLATGVVKGPGQIFSVPGSDGDIFVINY